MAHSGSWLEDLPDGTTVLTVHAYGLFAGLGLVHLVVFSSQSPAPLNAAVYVPGALLGHEVRRHMTGTIR